MTQDSKKHPTRIPGWDGSLEELARHVANLRYDELEHFFWSLAVAFGNDARVDQRRNRKRLAAYLRDLEANFFTIAVLTQKIFDLCRSHMKDELDE